MNQRNASNPRRVPRNLPTVLFDALGVLPRVTQRQENTHLGAQSLGWLGQLRAAPPHAAGCDTWDPGPTSQSGGEGGAPRVATKRLGLFSTLAPRKLSVWVPLAQKTCLSTVSLSSQGGPRPSLVGGGLKDSYCALTPLELACLSVPWVCERNPPTRTTPLRTINYQSESTNKHPRESSKLLQTCQA